MTGIDEGPQGVGRTGDTPPKPAVAHSKVRAASDTITEKLGLETIEGFSLPSFFSQVFSKHDPEAIESMFTVGSRETTPALNPQMGELPNPWIFFRVLVGAVAVYLLFLMAWNQFGNVNVIPGLIMAGSFAVPFSVLILFYEINTPRNVSLVRLMELVVAGGALSLLISLVLYDKLDFLGVFGASAAGIIEEIGKLAAVLLVMRLLPMSRYPYRINALLFGAAVGTGFAAFESAGYALRIGLNDSSAMLSNITLRGAMSPFGHIVWTAIATSAYWRARHENKDFASTVQSKRFLVLFSAPVALHFIWDMPFEGPFMIKYWVLGFVAWVIVISLIQSALREISERAAVAVVAM
jgi:RsiW-degrading membrane proteinase PrsW (M82 family)